MLTFEYKAKNNNGSLLTGQLPSQDRQTAIAALKQKGYYLLSVEPLGKVAAILNQNAGLTVRISTKDRAIFTHQLGVFI